MFRKLTIGLSTLGAALLAVLAIFFINQTSAVQPLSAPKLTNSTDHTTYDWFRDYRLKNFLPNSDSTYAATVPTAPSIESESTWLYPSYNSASIGFATNTPSIAAIEYGESNLSNRTEISESYLYTHLFHLRNLKESTTYNYRILIQDTKGNLVTGPTKSFTTKSFSGQEIKITNAYLENLTPYRSLTKANTTYVLTEDIRSDDLGINLKANNTVIDLNGHTIYYDCGASRINGAGWNDYAYGEQASAGIRSGLWNYHDTKILNGSIKQCTESTHFGYIGTGYNPILFTHFGNTDGTNEFAGLSLEWHSDSTAGANLPSAYIHHNSLKDTFKGGYCDHQNQANTVCPVDNRHQQHKQLNAGAASTVAYNQILRARQGGISGGKDIYGNEVYMDSYVTNSFGIQASSAGEFHHNRVFGMGYAANGSSISANTSAHDNLTLIYCEAPARRFAEYDRDSAVSGVRFTNYETDKNTFSNVHYYDNTIILKALSGCTQARGLWTVSGGNDSNNVFEGNIIKVEALAGNHDPAQKGSFYPGYINGVNKSDVNNAVAAIALGGAKWNGNNVKNSLTFRNNHLLSNVNIVLAGEGYSNAGNVIFEDNTIEKITANSEWFHWLRQGFWYWDSYDIRFINTIFVGFSGETEPPVNTNLNTNCGRGEYETALLDRRTYKIVNQYGQPYKNQTFTFRANENNTYAAAIKQAVRPTENLLKTSQNVTTNQAGEVTIEYPVSAYLCYGGTGEKSPNNSTKFTIAPTSYALASTKASSNYTLANLRTANTLVLNDPNAKNEDDNKNETETPAPTPNNPDSDTDKTGNTPSQNLPAELPHSGATTLPIISIASISVALAYFIQSRRKQ